ncbi:methyl-accepting chemotaxis protein, partial [Blastococcus aurantiacus]
MTTDVRTRTAPAASRVGLNWWGDRSVKVKVLSTVAVSAVITGTVGFMGLQALSSSADGAEDLYASNLRGVAAAGEMDVLVGDLRTNIRDTILGADPAASMDKVGTLTTDFRAAADAYRDTTDGDTDKTAALGEIVANMDAYATFQQDVLVPLARAQDFTAWIQQNAEQGAPLGTAVQEGIEELREVESAEAETVAASIRSDYESQRTIAIVLMVAGIGLALGLGFFVAAAIAASTRKVQDVATALADGDLTRSSGLTSKDELGRMGRSLDEAVTNLRSVLGQVAGSADAVAASSEELSASSAQISASAEETSA